MSSYVLNVFSTMEEARVVLSLLEAHGIPAELDCAYHAQNDWFIIQALGGVRLLVPTSLADEASTIISNALEETAPPLDPERQPAVGEKRNKRRLRRLSLSFFFFGAPQALVIIAVFLLLYYGVIDPPVFQERSIRVPTFDLQGMPLPPPAPDPITWDQGYHIGRSAILPGLVEFAMFWLLALAFSNFERARRKKNDPPR